MKKDYTDGVAFILHKDRTYSKVKFNPRTDNEIDVNGTKYKIDTGSMYQSLNWDPLYEFSFRHPFKSIKEKMRIKKIAIIVFNEEKGTVPRTNTTALADTDYPRGTPLLIRFISSYYGFGRWIKTLLRKPMSKRMLILIFVIIGVIIVMMYAMGIIRLG